MIDCKSFSTLMVVKAELLMVVEGVHKLIVYRSIVGTLRYLGFVSL